MPNLFLLIFPKVTIFFTESRLVVRKLLSFLRKIVRRTQDCISHGSLFTANLAVYINNNCTDAHNSKKISIFATEIMNK